MSLRYVGAPPGSDRSIANRSEVERYINNQIPGATSPALQARQRGATYPSAGEIDATLQGYVEQTALAQEAQKYLDLVDVGTKVAELSGGSLPQSQWPSGFIQTREASGVNYGIANDTITVLNRFSFTEVSRVTVVYPGYPWMPLITGYTQANLESGTRVEAEMIDQSGRVIARGRSWRGRRSQIALANITAPRYTGSQTFRLRLMIVEGTNAASMTSWNGQIMITPVPG